MTIEGNAVYNNVLHNRYHTMTGGWSQAIGVKGARISIRGNRVHPALRNIFGVRWLATAF